MATLEKERILQLRGEDLHGADGEKLGSIQEIYLDAETDQPEWALVSTGLFGSKSTFVPLRDATEAGGTLTVPFDKATVKDAPKIEPDGQLSQREEAELYRYYGMNYSEGSASGGTTSGGTTTRGTTSGGTTTRGTTSGGTTRGTTSGGTTTRGTTSGGTPSGGTPSGGTTGRDTSGEATTGGDAMTRSEEELDVGTTERETGRARLKKYVVTDEVEKTVPVRREEVRVEREPITDANADDAMSGPEISEAEHEVTLKEEEPVVEKRTVPKERVRLEKDVETDERQVSEEVRKERLEVEDDS